MLISLLDIHSSIYISKNSIMVILAATCAYNKAQLETLRNLAWSEKIESLAYDNKIHST